MELPQTCRCCLSAGAHRDLNTSYLWLNKKEVYSEMLQECFNIVLSVTPRSSAICEACVQQLRGACAFRQLVLHSEEELRSAGRQHDVKPEPEVKLEPEDDSDDYFLSEAVSAKDVAVENVKVECEAPARKKRRARKREREEKTSGKLTTAADLTAKKGRKASEAPRWGSSSQLKAKLRHNLSAVLQASNALPFRNKTLVGYQCAYCDNSYPDPRDLRGHTDADHTAQRLEHKVTFDLEYGVKLDITDLKCTICDESMENLAKLKEHLVKVHGKTIHEDVKDHLQQFKLKKGEVYDCAMCSATYETFKMLKQHMNKHYRNYTCSDCDTSFATRRSLNAHRMTHQEGSFKCDFCDKVFANKTKKHYHEKTKHLGNRSIANCPFCNESFRSYYQRNQHLTKVHNSETPYKCNVCDKVYALKSLLMYHIKKSHLMERNCQCTECGFRFFSKKALKAHMVKHSGERAFACDVCHKAYARKYTLREHKRIHADERRFRCARCALGFVQKCSLRAHLLAAHGVSAAARDISALT
ncbi:oocyte zinc finger protein XlCOF6-like [Plodia interpunctella]|uniref:oocyte zinc finger protein XlCOF6-like n=1 Tax=Plodia interpunctella TaxID=58824 RepID=UPI002368DC33|nr:oocyte zinc finger protein XlCOF6-like [Plodia interpunctella]